MNSDTEYTMTDAKSEEWAFYFGRGGLGMKKRKSSKVNELLQKLAPRYSTCHPTDRRLFAKHEVYHAVLKNGGAFFHMKDKFPVDITTDQHLSVTKIMQAFRDINKQCKIEPLRSRTISNSFSSPRKTKMNTKVPTKKVQSAKSPLPIMRLSPPKRKCVRPSIIEPPIMDCVRNALRMFDVDESIPELNSDRGEKHSDRSNPVSGGVSGQNPLNKDSVHHFSTNDAFETMIVEPPKLENSFSALIMADEITAYLPTDSQKSINQNLHKRVQRLENLVSMLMQQQNEDLERLL